MKIRQQKGFTLIELAITSVIAAIAIGLGLYYQSMQMRFEVARAQADNLLLVNNALTTYETNYYSNLLSNTPVPGVANEYAPTIAELKALQILDAGVSSAGFDSNPFQAKILPQPAGCGAASGVPCTDITGLVYYGNPIKDSYGNIDYPALGEAISQAGGNAGYSSQASPGSIIGGNGNWSLPNPEGSVQGILAIRSGYMAQGLDQFLRRDGAKGMTGNLKMNQDGSPHNISGVNDVASNSVTTNSVSAGTVNAGNVAASNVSASGTVTGNTLAGATGNLATVNATTANSTTVNATNVNASNRVTAPTVQVTATAFEGWGCSPNGLIAQNGQGQLLSCQSSLWKKVGGGSFQRNTVYWVGGSSYVNLGVHAVCVLSGTQNNFNSTVGNTWARVDGSINSGWYYQTGGHTPDYGWATCFD